MKNGRAPRFTITVATVMDHLIQNPNSSGYEIMQATGLHTGTMYPILDRLEHAGWIESVFEIGDPSILGRPLRNEHVVTDTGRKAVREQAMIQHEIMARLSGA